MTLELLRYTVFVVFVGATGIALGSWAVRTRRINPFSPVARVIRQISDPVLLPIERWQHRRGGNPQHAPWWLLGFAVVGGIVLITLAEWLLTQAARAAGAARGGPRGLLRLAVYYAGQLVLLAIIVRVVASWLGAFRYNKWMRPVYLLTDWVVEPLRRIIPPIGMIDLSPIIAWFAIRLVLGWLMQVL